MRETITHGDPSSIDAGYVEARSQRFGLGEIWAAIPRRATQE
jgi:hypothetical protein